MIVEIFDMESLRAFSRAGFDMTAATIVAMPTPTIAYSIAVIP
nr:hypothetical protein [Marinomonas algicola]